MGGRSFALATIAHNLDFSKYFVLFIYKLIDQAIYWTKYEVDFILCPLSEIERSPYNLAL